MLFSVRSTGLLESGMFVNIHPSAIKNEPTVLMTPDKVCDDMTDVVSRANCCNCICKERSVFYLIKLIFKTHLYNTHRCYKCFFFTRILLASHSKNAKTMPE